MKYRSDTHYKGMILKLIISALALAFWIGAIYNQKLMEASHGTIGVRYREAVITEQLINDILEGMRSKKDADIPQITLWKREEQARINNEELGRLSKVDLITVAGDMSQVCQDPVIIGGYLSPEDTVGCIIDRTTAYELYGSENIIGMELKLADQKYIVRGVLKATAESSMYINAGRKKGSYETETYSCMELSFAESDKADVLAKNFIQTYGLGEPSEYYNGYRYQTISELLVHLPIWLCVFGIIIYSIRAVGRLKGSLFLSLIGYLVVIGLSLLLIRMANLRINIPDSMIPNRWSDLDFWVGKGKEFLMSLRGSSDTLRYYGETVPTRRLICIIAGVLVTVIAGRYIIKEQKHTI